MYQYLPIEQAKPGSIVQAITTSSNQAFIKDQFYIIRTLKDEYDNIGIIVDSNGLKTNGWCVHNFKHIAVKLGIDAKVGDTVVCIKNTEGNCKVGDSFIVHSANTFYIRPKSGTNFSGLLSEEVGSWEKDYFVTLCEESEHEQTPHRNLAFYKRKETPWTQEEYENVVNFTEGKACKACVSISKNNALNKFIFDQGSSHSFQYMWHLQKDEPNFNNCTQVAYEDVFGVGPCVLSTTNPDLFIEQILNTQYKPIQKENTMNNSLQEILSAIFGSDKPTTDYDKRKAVLVVVYGRDGKTIATASADSVEQVAQEMQSNPELWGCKVLTYKLSKELFVDVPVTINKAQIASKSEAE